MIPDDHGNCFESVEKMPEQQTITTVFKCTIRLNSRQGVVHFMQIKDSVL